MRASEIIMPPSHTALPAMLWPPLRTATRRSCSRRETNGARHVGGPGALHDQSRPAVDHRVPDGARSFVSVGVGCEHNAADPGGELSDRFGIELGGCAIRGTHAEIRHHGLRSAFDCLRVTSGCREQGVGLSRSAKVDACRRAEEAAAIESRLEIPVWAGLQKGE